MGMLGEGGVLIGPVARRDSGFRRSGQFSGFRDGNRNQELGGGGVKGVMVAYKQVGAVS